MSRFQAPRSWTTLLIALVALFGLNTCAQEIHPPEVRHHTVKASTADGGVGVGTFATNVGCTTVHSAEPVPARVAVLSTDVVAGDRTMLVNDLFFLFKSNCGACHVEGTQGEFHVTPTEFSFLVNQDVVDQILSDDPKKVMPPLPGGKLAKDRMPGDPVLQLVSLLQRWIAAGSPRDVFVIPADTTQDTGVSPYLMTESVGMALSNIGDCIPDSSVVASDPTNGTELDAFFEKLERKPPGQGTQLERIGLPLHLKDTDLVTLDAATLSHHGVIAYAPTYPLWSDNARKIRHIRVPQGKSVVFHKDTQTFEIPPNTRFYKTFLKKVIDVDGTERYRKVETRLIVSRPPIAHDDGTVEQTALFGAYVWNPEETDAVLNTDTLRDGEPFTDKLITLVTDEPKAQAVRDSKPKDEAAALQTAGVLRHYAIPGRDRCIQCHMGSPSESFILGFTPLQINRRQIGEGGVIEPAGDDELTQLDRLIAYKVITGIDSAADITVLEKSEGTREPRNEYELRAQGYMVGNCAHCHNPRGYPTQTNPVLADLLNFLPSPTGGIFQFPLERFSPRITRGQQLDVQIPYITPSLVDYPSPTSDKKKYMEFEDGLEQIDRTDGSETALIPRAIIFAPWRSLIYRNVDTPFTYEEDLALFPHMPMNVPGFDVRAPRILGDWMVSIPAARKVTTYMGLVGGHEQPVLLQEYRMPPRTRGQSSGLYDTVGTDDSPQPYAEVKPGEPGYDDAVKAAQVRLTSYHQGTANVTDLQGVEFNGLYTFVQPHTYSRYTYTPDTSDIIDRAITGADQHHLVPQDLLAFTTNGEVAYWDQNARFPLVDSARPVAPFELAWPFEGVPDRPHWVVTDVTETPPPWAPRRPDWKRFLIDHDYPALYSDQQKQIIEYISPKDGKAGGASLSTVSDYALKPIPFGLWKQNAGCDFSGIRKAGSYSGSTRPKWMDGIVSKVPDDAPVYELLPGAAIFNMICINCHGPNADSRGRQADTLMIMTGGDARVANFRAGLFGPADHPSQNRTTEFTVLPGDGGAPGADAGPSNDWAVGISADDWAARYMAWMGLGGTSKLIPPAILTLVANTPVLGVKRNYPTAPNSANMLSTAAELCGQLINTADSGLAGGPATSWDNMISHSAFIRGPSGELANGDGELWAHLCPLGNPMPVRGVIVYPNGQVELSGLYPAKAYPADAPVGDDRGKIVTWGTASNLMPWCVLPPDAALSQADRAAIAAVLDRYKIDGQPLPMCPSAVASAPILQPQDRQAWAVRGAINAGLAVFLYLNQMLEKSLPVVPPYDHCEQLPKP